MTFKGEYRKKDVHSIRELFDVKREDDGRRGGWQ